MAEAFRFPISVLYLVFPSLSCLSDGILSSLPRHEAKSQAWSVSSVGMAWEQLLEVEDAPVRNRCGLSSLSWNRSWASPYRQLSEQKSPFRGGSCPGLPQKAQGHLIDKLAPVDVALVPWSGRIHPFGRRITSRDRNGCIGKRFSSWRKGGAAIVPTPEDRWVCSYVVSQFQCRRNWGSGGKLYRLYN